MRTHAKTDYDFVGGRVVDPSTGLDANRTLSVRNGRIAAISDGAPHEHEGVERIDCAGMLLCPGFIDPHTHLRGFEESYKETIATALAAAAAGGFTAVAAMPNTQPPMDNAGAIRRLLDEADRAGPVRCYPIGAITLGREGEAIASLRSMAQAGAVAFSDDGSSVASLKALYNAARHIADLRQPMLSHCEDRSFASGLMHEGETSDRLGIPGVPAVAEGAIAARDLLVAQATGKAWHICHVSTAQTTEILRWARATGIRATGEATPHHLQLTDEALAGFDARLRVNPPLRPAGDVAALKRAVADGVVTIFASDHAPHAEWEKQGPLADSCVGFSGLETAVAATFDALPHLPLARLVAGFSTNVADLLGVTGGSLAIGAPADITGLYLERPWRVDPAKFKSMGRVSPFAGRSFKVQPALTVVEGEIVYRAGATARARGRVRTSERQR